MTSELSKATHVSQHGLPRTLISGRATPVATHAYASRFISAFADGFYRDASAELTVSSLGMGTYLGECDDTEDQRYENLLEAGIDAGINILDTAINYRCQRSEKTVGRALRRALATASASRDEIVVCSKGGYIPLDGTPPASRDAYKAYLKSEYFDHGIMSQQEVVAGGHCLSPRFLSDQIERSRTNIGIDCIDVFYVHNPEQQLDVLSRTSFLGTMREAFGELEAQVAAGTIACYGCATWNGFRVFPANKNYLSLQELLAVAVDVGGQDHHFRVIQLPVNLAMTEGVRSPTQHNGTTNLPLVEIAKDHGISVVASASLMQAQLTRNLPRAVESLYPGHNTDAQRAIEFVRSLPITSALVGMRLIEHLRENLASARPSIPLPAIRS